MRVVIQRVAEASITIEKKVFSKINKGLLILLGIEDADTNEDVAWLCGKICRLRIFNDDQGVMNLSAIDIESEFLVVSQFTLMASTKKGNRPSYIKASKPVTAVPLYNHFLKKLSDESGLDVKTGVFGADMKVSLINEGPVTIIIDTKHKE